MKNPNDFQIKQTIIGDLDGEFKQYHGGITSELNQYLISICVDLDTAWNDWQSQVKFGGASVSGMGIGGWSGNGNGGAFNMQFSLNLNPKYNTPDEAKLTSKLNARIKEAFNSWISSYQFAGVSFVGSSTATPQSPGAFNAMNTPINISSGNKSGFANLGSLVRSDMGWDYSKSKTGLLADAICSAIKSLHDSWVSSTFIMNNSAMGVAAPGSGNGASASSMDGMVV